MTSDEKTLNTKFDHLSKIYSCYIAHFSHLRNFYQTLVTTPWISCRLSKTMSHTYEIWTIFYSNFLKWKMAYIRIVDLDELNKLGIQNFSIWDNLGFRKLVCKHRNLKITNLNRPNYLKWKVDQNKNCRSWWVEQTWYSKLFNLKSFRVHNTRVKVLFFHLTKFDLVKLAQMRH